MQWPKRTYVHCIDQDKSLTYGDLYSVSNQAAQFLKSYDIQANDRVLLLAENSVENLAVFVSVLRYGATLATVTTVLAVSVAVSSSVTEALIV